MAGRHLPEAPNFAEGLTALHGIEAVREWRSTNRALSGLPTKCGSTETAPVGAVSGVWSGLELVDRVDIHIVGIGAVEALGYFGGFGH